MFVRGPALGNHEARFQNNATIVGSDRSRCRAVERYTGLNNNRWTA